MKRYCGACGTAIVGDERFCGACGAMLGSPPIQQLSTDLPVSSPVFANNIAYDPQIINQYASWLYDRALKIIIFHMLIGCAFGFISLLILAEISRGADENVVSLFGGLVGGLIGYWIGSQKAYWLKLQAQLALCQVEIERNTRNPEVTV
jgi:hypothetical protein